MLVCVLYSNTQWSPAQKGVLTDMLSEHDFKCIWAARNRPMCVAKMIGAVYRSWFTNVEEVKKLAFGKYLAMLRRAIVSQYTV